jgi:hypothetical protein
VEQTFFYLRAKDFVGFGAAEAITAFAAGFPYHIGKPIATRPEDINDRHEIEIIGFGKEEITWSNGLAFRFRSNVGPDEIERIMTKSLSYFEEWTIFQPSGLFVQRGRSSLREFAWTMAVGSVAQVYMMSAKDDIRLKTWITEIKSNIKGPAADVIDFTDGAILFVTTDQPAPTIASRCAKQFEKLENWAIVDGSGYTHSKFDRGNVWRRIKLPPIMWVDDDGNDDDGVD